MGLPGARPVTAPNRIVCGRSRPVNDMWIAACCLAHEVPLATLNLKDYQAFTGHHGLRLLS